MLYKVKLLKKMHNRNKNIKYSTVKYSRYTNEVKIYDV